MTVLALPSSPGALSKARWEDIAPYFDDLAERPLDETTIEGWLQTWSTLEELVTEAAALAMIAYTIETSDPEKEADHLRFSTEILPKMEERSVELAAPAGGVRATAPRRWRPRWPGSAPRSRSSARPTCRSSPSWRS